MELMALTTVTILFFYIVAHIKSYIILIEDTFNRFLRYSQMKKPFTIFLRNLTHYQYNYKIIYFP